MRLVGKVAHVTGAGAGIGKAIAVRFAAEGAKVLVSDVDEAAAANTVGEIDAAGGTALSRRVDVRSETDIAAALDAAEAAFGLVDIQVCNAATKARQPFLEMDPAFWREVLEINLTGVFLVAQAAARRMVAAGRTGKIIPVASNSGLFGGRGRAAYGASKAGIVNLTQTMAIELAEHGILVNAIGPGPTRSEPGLPPLSPSVDVRMPLKRYGEPEEIAAAALFLATDDASFVTGQVLMADGGFTTAGIMEG